MMDERTETTPVFDPRDAASAARFFEKCTAAARKGSRFSVQVLESPFADPSLSGLTGGTADPDEAARLISDPGAEGDDPVLPVSHSGFSKIEEVSKLDMLLEAGGGVLLRDAVAAASDLGLFFPHSDILLPEDITLAGLLMDGPVTPFSGAFGPLREYILSIELVTPAGARIHSGSRAIKDVAGYEIIGYMIGRGARCGMISSVTLRLLPEPPSRLKVAAGGKAESVASLPQALEEKYRLVSAEIFAGRPAEIVSKLIETDGAKSPDNGALLLAELHSPVKGTEERMLSDMRASAPDLIIEPVKEPFGAVERDTIRELAGEYGALSLLSFDGDEAPGGPRAVASWKSVYPLRRSLLIERGSGSIYESRDHADPASRARLYDVESRSGRLIGRRRHVYEDVPIEERIDRVFDPEGIMER